MSRFCFTLEILAPVGCLGHGDEPLLERLELLDVLVLLRFGELREGTIQFATASPAVGGLLQPELVKQGAVAGADLGVAEVERQDDALSAHRLHEGDHTLGRFDVDRLPVRRELLETGGGEIHRQGGGLVNGQSVGLGDFLEAGAPEVLLAVLSPNSGAAAISSVGGGGQDGQGADFFVGIGLHHCKTLLFLF